MSMPVGIALAGLFITISLQGAAFAFFMGRLTQRVITLEKAGEGDGDLSEKVIRLDEQMKVANKSLEQMDRHLQGINRQLANIATGAFKTQMGVD